MKLRTIALGLSLLSTSVLAQDYQTEVNADYLTVDSFNTIALSGAYYFDAVSTENTAWAEAAFMGRKNNVNLSYIDFDGDADQITLGGQFYSNDIYAALSVNYIDIDGFGSDTVISGELGYFFSEDWLVAISGNDEDFSDTLGLRTKYVAKLDNNKFFNFEAAYSDASEDFTFIGDYYWTAKSSVGLTLSDQNGFDFGLQASHFFTPSVALNVTYRALENDDLVGVGITGRF